MKLYKRETQTTVWTAALTGMTLTTSTGLLYGVAKQTKKRFKSPAAAKAGLAEAAAAQRAKGFGTLGQMAPPEFETPRNATLEAEIRKQRADGAPYLVYADWLQSQGCPLGEALVMVQRKKQKPALAIMKRIGIPDESMATVGWRHGMWEWLKLDNQIDSMPDEGDFDVLAFVRPLFASPLCAALEELRIGMLRWEFQDQRDVITEAGKHAWAADLLRLRVGDVADDIDMNHHTIGELGKAITKAFPNLESLWLHSGAQDWDGPKTFELGGFELPKLRTLTIETCALSRKRMKQLATATFPALESLELWVGSPDGDGNAKLADIAPVWGGKLFPKLRHLGLCNTALVTDIVRILPDAPIAKQLESLDLSKGTLNDSDAGELAESARAFKSLRTLRVDDNWLTAAGIRALKKAFPSAKLSTKDQQELLDPEDYGTDRFVSVSE